MPSERLTRRALIGRVIATAAAALLPRWIRPTARAGAQGFSVDVRAYGARGDGAHDDSAAVQAAIDSARKAGGGSVRFPPGTYLVADVNIYPGISYLGERAILLRPPDVPPGTMRKGTRTFTTQHGRYAGDQDSAPLVIKGLTFDGNVERQGSKQETAQAHLLFLTARHESRGRLRVVVEDCTFQHSPADAITIYTNVDAEIRNCRVHNCRRGALVLNGGNSRVRVANFRATAGQYAPRIDMEVGGRGSNRSKAVELTLDRVYCEGNVELELNAGSTVTADQLQAAGPLFNLSGHGVGQARFTNCIINMGAHQQNRIEQPGSVVFERCRFRAVRLGPKADLDRVRAVNVIWHARDVSRNQIVRLVNCDFVVDRQSVPAAVETTAVFTDADALEYGNRLVVEGGTIAADYRVGFQMLRGGNWTVKGTTILAPVAFRLEAPRGVPLRVVLEDVLIAGSRRSVTLTGDDVHAVYP